MRPLEITSEKMTGYQWPWQYNFPPFYTLQPNLDTRQKQIEGWCNLVLDYHRQHRQYRLDVTEAQSSELFNNKSINRKLPSDVIYLVLDELCKKSHVEWTDKTRKQCLVMWRTPEEWGKLLYKWASSTGNTNTVCTLYELSNGDDTTNEEFHGLDSWLLTRALKTLEHQRKAELISYDGSEGVKFF